MAKKKKYTTDNGSRCSGYGVYPDGRKCKGCSDCQGKFIKKPITTGQVIELFRKQHSIKKISKKKK